MTQMPSLGLSVPLSESLPGQAGQWQTPSQHSCCPIVLSHPPARFHGANPPNPQEAGTIRRRFRHGGRAWPPRAELCSPPRWGGCTPAAPLWDTRSRMTGSKKRHWWPGVLWDVVRNRGDPFRSRARVVSPCSGLAVGGQAESPTTGGLSGQAPSRPHSSSFRNWIYKQQSQHVQSGWPPQQQVHAHQADGWFTISSTTSVTSVRTSLFPATYEVLSPTRTRPFSFPQNLRVNLCLKSVFSPFCDGIQIEIETPQSWRLTEALHSHMEMSHFAGVQEAEILWD